MRLLVAMSASLAMLAVARASATDNPVDLALVLAVDASASVDDDEQYLQRQGYVAAFQSPLVLSAIRSGPLRRIAVTYIEWGDSDTQAIVVPWTVIEDKTSQMAFAFNIADARINHFFGTSIAGALRYSGALSQQVPAGPGARWDLGFVCRDQGRLSPREET